MTRGSSSALSFEVGPRRAKIHEVTAASPWEQYFRAQYLAFKINLNNNGCSLTTAALDTLMREIEFQEVCVVASPSLRERMKIALRNIQRDVPDYTYRPTLHR